MTRKLFYEDAYLKIFDAVVTGCRQARNGWEVTLDATAFYPEGGGQPADTGTLAGVRVLDVHEKDGEILHLTDAPLETGAKVEGRIDWERRFSLMQQHTGEHIVSGWVNRLFKLDNVGFHMGHEAVTVDFNGELTAENLAQVELLANRTVYSNLPVQKSYPSPEELSALEYRSKKELTGEIRIVTVPGCDVCACCGLHVGATGEVGIIKLLFAQRYKGGTRVAMLCAGRALEDYAEKNTSVAGISGLLSAKPAEVAQAVKRMLEENASLKMKLTSLQNELFSYKAAACEEGAPVVCLFEPDLAPNELRKLCLMLSERCGIAAVFSGSEAEEYKYAVGSLKDDVRELGKKLNAAFSGRGGGTREVVQGSVCGAPVERLRAFLAEYADSR